MRRVNHQYIIVCLIVVIVIITPIFILNAVKLSPEKAFRDDYTVHPAANPTTANYINMGWDGKSRYFATSDNGLFYSIPISTKGKYSDITVSFSSSYSVNVEVSTDNGLTWCKPASGGKIKQAGCKTPGEDFMYRVNFEFKDGYIDFVKFRWDSLSQCADFGDNDNDNAIDADDFSCLDSNGAYNPLDNDEGNPKAECQDTFDNDNDTFIDYPNDNECASFQDNSELGGGGQALTPVVQASRTSCVAPCGVFFDATETTSILTNNAFEELEYEWEFGDPSSFFVNRPGEDANKAKGAIAGHVFDKPGNYIINLNVKDINGNLASESITIDVQDPEAVYSGKTWCVSTNNKFADCPTTNSQFHLTSFDSAIDKLFESAGPRRILFHKGEKFLTYGKSKSITTDGPYAIGAYGVGADPIIFGNTTLTNKTLMQGDILIFYNKGVRDFSVAGLRFESNYNAATGIGMHPNGLVFLNGIDVTIYRNSFYGLETNVHAGGDSQFGLFEDSSIADNHMTNWQNFGIWGVPEEIAIIGNIIKQNPNAKSGSEAKCQSCVPNFPDHGPIRLATMQKVIVSKNDMFNNAGWSSDGLAHQPIMRFPSDGLGNLSIASDNIMEGGFGIISSGTSGNGTQGIIGRVIYERNTLIATNNTETAISFQLGGTVIRNNLIIKPNNGGHAGIGEGEFNVVIVAAKYEKTIPYTQINTDTPNYIYGNTFVSLEQNKANKIKFFVVQNNSTAYFTLKNNIMYAPYASNSETGLVRWESSTAKISDFVSDNNLHYTKLPNFAYVGSANQGTYYTLVQWQSNYNKDLKSLLNDPILDPLKNWYLQPNSPAINAGDDVPVLDDFAETPRPQGAAWDIGCWEFVGGP